MMFSRAEVLNSDSESLWCSCAPKRPAVHKLCLCREGAGATPQDGDIVRLSLIYTIDLLIHSCVMSSQSETYCTLPSSKMHCLLQVEVHWSGYTAGYQGKRIDNTSVRDEPYRFRVGSGQVRESNRLASVCTFQIHMHT